MGVKMQGLLFDDHLYLEADNRGLDWSDRPFKTWDELFEHYRSLPVFGRGPAIRVETTAADLRFLRRLHQHEDHSDSSGAMRYYCAADVIATGCLAITDYETGEPL